METAIRRDSSHHSVIRSAIGIDRRVTLWGRDLYGVIEYQHDGYGAERAPQLIAAATSSAAMHQELQVYGRDEAATQLTYQIHPLVSAELLSLVNLRDGSALFSPAISVSVETNVTLRIGGFLGTGPSGTIAMPRSEYGPLPTTAYAALSAFF